MKKGLRYISTAALLLAVLSGCAQSAKPVDDVDPPSVSLPVVTPEATAKMEAPNGWYEPGSYEVMLFLSSEQGKWRFTPVDGYDVYESISEGYTTFAFAPWGEAGNFDFLFTCETSQCAISLFVNEAGEQEVSYADVSARVRKDYSVPETPIEYTLDYTRSPVLLEKTVGKQVVEDAKLVIEAFLDRKTSVQLSVDSSGWDSAYHLNTVGYALGSMCPPFYALTDFCNVIHLNEGLLEWSYILNEEETDMAVRAFEECVNGIMAHIDTRDCETMRAMIAYNALVENAVYDYAYIDVAEHTSEEERDATSAYNAIVKGTGVCFSYADALCFLWGQLGLNAIRINGDSPEMFHSWVYAELDEEGYYFDPSWDVGGSFKYFGLTEDDRCGRAGSFDRNTFTACWEEVDMKPDSKRFSCLYESLDAWNADFEPNHAKQTASFLGGTLYITCLPEE